jgi:hypothetical protein
LAPSVQKQFGKIPASVHDCDDLDHRFASVVLIKDEIVSFHEHAKTWADVVAGHIHFRRTPQELQFFVHPQE